MVWLLVAKGVLILILLRFGWITVSNNLKDPTLLMSLDLSGLMEIATVLAITLACLFSSLSQGTLFILMVALIDAIVLFFEGKRLILIGDTMLQVREKAIKITEIQTITTSLATLKIQMKTQTLKVMNPLVVSWQFQERVYQRIGGKQHA